MANRRREDCAYRGTRDYRGHPIYPSGRDPRRGQAHEVGEALCMTLDHESQTLYWAAVFGDRVMIKKLQLDQIDPFAEDVFSLAGEINSIASYQVR